MVSQQVPGMTETVNWPLTNHDLPELKKKKKSMKERCSSGRLEKLAERAAKRIFKKHY